MSKRAMKMAAMAGTVGLLGTAAAACGSHPAAAAKPLAVINGQALTKADWQAAVNATDLLQGVSMATTKTAEKQQVKQLATEIAVEQYALQHHWITKTKAASEAKTFVKQNATTALGGTKQMEATLKKQHLSVATFTQFMTQQMELQAAFARATKGLKPVTKAQALNYYNTHKSSFPQPAQDEMRMILVKQKSLAESIMKQLENGGSWKTLAAKYSLDPASKSKGGEYGWVDTGPQSNFVTSFYQEMDKLKAGQYGIAHTQYGYHVIEVQATKPAGTQPFSKVSNEIESGLQQQQQDKTFQTFSNNIAKKFHIKLNV